MFDFNWRGRMMAELPVYHVARTKNNVCFTMVFQIPRSGRDDRYRYPGRKPYREGSAQENGETLEEAISKTIVETLSKYPDAVYRRQDGIFNPVDLAKEKILAFERVMNGGPG